MHIPPEGFSETQLDTPLLYFSVDPITSPYADRVRTFTPFAANQGVSVCLTAAALCAVERCVPPRHPSAAIAAGGERVCRSETGKSVGRLLSLSQTTGAVVAAGREWWAAATRLYPSLASVLCLRG